MIPSGYSRNVLVGHLPGGEIFACGYWTDEAPSDLAATQTQADNFAADWAAKTADPGHPQSLLGGQGGYDHIKVYSYLDNTGKATYQAEADLSNPATSTNPQLPNQCSLVATLETGQTGRRRRGRVYLPCIVATLTNGQLPDTTVTNVAGWMADYFAQNNSHIGTQHVVVLSQVAGDSVPVNAIRVDSRVDIQRRRANKEIPAFTETVTF